MNLRNLTKTLSISMGLGGPVAYGQAVPRASHQSSIEAATAKTEFHQGVIGKLTPAHEHQTVQRSYAVQLHRLDPGVLGVADRNESWDVNVTSWRNDDDLVVKKAEMDHQYLSGFLLMVIGIAVVFDRLWNGDSTTNEIRKILAKAKLGPNGLKLVNELQEFLEQPNNSIFRLESRRIAHRYYRDAKRYHIEEKFEDEFLALNRAAFYGHFLAAQRLYYIFHHQNLTAEQLQSPDRRGCDRFGFLEKMLKNWDFLRAAKFYEELMLVMSGERDDVRFMSVYKD